MVPPLALLFICAVCAFALANLIPIVTFTAPLWLVAFELVIGAAFLLPAVTIFVKHETTVSPLSPSSATTLVTNGVFGMTRNPMYVGMLLLLLGFALWLGAISSLAMVVAFFALVDRKQIPAEERSLLDNFGDDYRSYCKRVPRWLFVHQEMAK